MSTATKTGSITHHPLVPEDRTAMQTMRSQLPAAKIALSPSMRAPFDEMMSHTPAAAGVTYELGAVGGVPGWWVRPTDALEQAVILYLHGGAYVIGSARSARSLASQLAMRTQTVAFVADYRLAPEHPFPAAVDDALAVYKGLAAQRFKSILFAGDSAGGGLALVTLAQAVTEARAGRGVVPRGAVVISPWVDLTLNGSSFETGADADPLLSKDNLAGAAALYLAGHSAVDPHAIFIMGGRTSSWFQPQLLESHRTQDLSCD